MRDETNQGPPECKVAVAARARTAAADLAHRLEAAGVSAVAMELERALDGGAPVVLLDPGGWEAECRRTLSAFDTRPGCPPAVLLTGSDPSVAHRVGPAFGFLSPDEEPRRLAGAAARACRARERFARRWPEPLAPIPRGELRHFLEALEGATGIEVRPDREGVLVQAVRSRMVGGLWPSARDYAAAVARSPEEAEALAELLSVGETYFWRYASQYRALQSLLRPPGGGARPLRIWSAGCATGEEPYSLAIACLEALGPQARLEVVATDLNLGFLSRAAAGRFGERSLRELPRHLRGRYLEAAPDGGAVVEAIRRRVRFARLNLGGAALAPWVRENGPFDAIFCRNTLIYLSRGATDRIVAEFSGALVEGGGLFLGAAESLLARRADLEVCRAPGSFYYRKASRAPTVPPGPAVAEGAPLDGRIAALWGAGLEALDSEDFQGAATVFGEILELSPEDSRGHAGLAFLLANEGREGEAAGHLDRACRGGPPLPETRYLKGLLAERRGDELEALRQYREALGIDPAFFMAHMNRAWILRRLGRQDGFAEEMRAALAILRVRPRVAPWLTGGVGRDGLLGLVGEALAEAADG